MLSSYQAITITARIQQKRKFLHKLLSHEHVPQGGHLRHVPQEPHHIP